MTTHDNRLTACAAARPLLLLALAAWPALNAAPATAAERRAQAPAQNPRLTVDGAAPERKEFRLGGFNAWLTRSGEWHIEGPVRHRGLACGTYEVGMRVGIGKPDCTDVQWLSPVRYVSSQSQCNDAELPHSGSETDESLSSQFDAISCAERVIRCSGNCK